MLSLLSNFSLFNDGHTVISPPPPDVARRRTRPADLRTCTSEGSSVSPCNPDHNIHHCPDEPFPRPPPTPCPKLHHPSATLLGLKVRPRSFQDTAWPRRGVGSRPRMLAPPNTEPQHPEEDRAIPDNLMTLRPTQTPSHSQPQPIIFRAKHDKVLDLPPAKKDLKGTMKKTKNRSSTPRPIVKGGGRKRFSFSPSPGSKQSLKKITNNDLTEERGRRLRNKRNLMADLSEAAGMPNLPTLATSLVAAEGSRPNTQKICPPVNECRDLVTFSLAPPKKVSGPPNSDPTTGTVDQAIRDKGHTLHHHWSKAGESSCSDGALGEGLVNIPEIRLETN